MKKTILLLLMNKLCFVLCTLFLATVCYAGETADKQMDKFTDFLKKAKYKEAASSLLTYGLNTSDEQKDVKITQYAGHFKRFIKQHGKILNHTKLRTRQLSKQFDETVYQINCEKSAWLIMIREYSSPNGKSQFSELRILTEDDVFKYYEKR